MFLSTTLSLTAPDQVFLIISILMRYAYFVPRERGRDTQVLPGRLGRSGQSPSIHLGLGDEWNRLAPDVV